MNRHLRYYPDKQDVRIFHFQVKPIAEVCTCHKPDSNYPNFTTAQGKEELLAYDR